MNRGSPPRTENEFDEWLEAATERLDSFMAWLGLMFALLVGYEIAVDLTPGVARALMIAGWVVWAVFALEFAAKLWLAPRRARFLKRHWFSGRSASDPDVARPPLRASRASRPGIARRACHQRFLPRARARAAAAPIATRYLGAASTAAAIAAAELAYLFERDRDEPVFENFGDAVIWGFSTVLALQADPVPESAAARVVMLVAFLFGLVIVASLAGTVGAFLVDHRQGERRSSASE